MIAPQENWSYIDSSSSKASTTNSNINDIFTSPVVKAVIPGYFSQGLIEEFAIIKQNTIEFYSTLLKDDIFQCLHTHQLSETVVDAVGLSIKSELDSELSSAKESKDTTSQGRDVILLSLDTGQVAFGVFSGRELIFHPWALHDPSNKELGFGTRRSLHNGEPRMGSGRQHVQQILRLFASIDGKSFGVLSESSAWICPWQIGQSGPRLHVVSVESRRLSYIAFVGFTVHLNEFILQACLLGDNSSDQYIHLLILARTLEAAGQEDAQSTVKIILFEALPLKVEQPDGEEERQDVMLAGPRFTVKQYPPFPIQRQYENTLFFTPIAKSSAAAMILYNHVVIVTPHEIMSGVTDLLIQSLNASQGSVPSAAYPQKGEAGLFLGFDDGAVVYFYIDDFEEPKIKNTTKLPVQIGPGFAILNNVLEDHLVIVAGGESSNGGIFAISAHDDIPLPMMSLPCWTPVADVTSRRKKDRHSEIVVKESGAYVTRPDTLYLASGLGQFGSVQELTRAIGSQLSMVGPEVKGAAKIFSFSTNDEEVALCVSYPWGTSLYILEQSTESLIDLQDNHHFDGSSETLAMGIIEIANEKTKYLSIVQVTRQSINFTKIYREENFQDFLTAETSTIAGPFIQATINGDLIATILRDNSTSQVMVYKFKTLAGTDELTIATSQSYSIEDEISILSALDTKIGRGPLVVGTRGGRIIAMDVSQDPQDCHGLVVTGQDMCQCHSPKEIVPPSSITLLSSTVLLVGSRNGELRYYKKQPITPNVPVATNGGSRHLQDMFDEPEGGIFEQQVTSNHKFEFLLESTYKFRELPIDLIRCPLPEEGVLVLGSGEIWKAKPCGDELEILPLRLGNDWSENVTDLCFIDRANSVDETRLQHDLFCIQMDKLCLFTFCPCLYPNGIWTRTFEIKATPFRVLYLSHSDMIAVISRLSEGDNGKSPLAFIDRRSGNIISDSILIDSRKQASKDGLTVNESLFARGEYARCFCEWRINIGGNTYVYLVVGGGKPGHLPGFHRGEWGKVRILRVSRKGSEGRVVLKCQMSWTCENPVVGIAAIGDYSLTYIQGENLEIKTLNPETLKFVLAIERASIRPLRPVLSACQDEIVCLGDAATKLKILQRKDGRLTTFESIAVEDTVIRGVFFAEEQCLFVTTFNGLLRIFAKDIDGRYRDSGTLVATDLSSAQTGVCQGRLMVPQQSQKCHSLITVGVDGQILQIELTTG